VTNHATRSPRGFVNAPPSPLQPGQHQVKVAGTDGNGATFNRGWPFTTTGGSSVVGQIVNVRPPNGATVPKQFTLTGRTTPGAHVTIQVGVGSGGPTTIGAIIGSILSGGGQTNSQNYSLTADANGNFAQQVNVSSPSGSQLVLVINATDSQTGATATPVQETLTVQ
jgi:hypothetical protein